MQQNAISEEKIFEMFGRVSMERDLLREAIAKAQKEKEDRERHADLSK